jgi:hypothetical protein
MQRKLLEQNKGTYFLYMKINLKGRKDEMFFQRKREFSSGQKKAPLPSPLPGLMAVRRGLWSLIFSCLCF